MKKILAVIAVLSMLSASTSALAAPVTVKTSCNKTPSVKVIKCGNINVQQLLEKLGVKCKNCTTPTAKPTAAPTAKPTAVPTAKPTAVPTAKPTAVPTAKPTAVPTAKPTAVPTAKPTTAPTTAPVQSSNSDYAAEVVRLVNVERAKQGLSQLTQDAVLTNAANKRAVEIKTSFSHTRPNGQSFSSVLKEYGVNYRNSGENIAYGQKTPADVVNAWMNSAGHRANILNTKYSKIGVGVYKSGSTYYWTQLFTN